MMLHRRQFLLLTAGLVTGCQTVESTGKSNAGEQRAVNAGLARDYAGEGVYNRFSNQGFFVVRKNGSLFAISAICTHRKCQLASEPDHSFLCKCHGSTFDPDGHVTKGPAKRDLPILPSHTNEQGELIVSVPEA